MSNKFTKDTTLAEVLKHPKAEEILQRYGMPCLSCPMAKREMNILKIGQIAVMYGIDPEKLLKEFNENEIEE